MIGEVLEGKECKRTVKVEEQHLAEHLREKGVEAVSTPSLLYFAESTVRSCLEERLSPKGYTSVGVWATIKHMARVPSGEELEVKGRILNHSGKRLTAYVTITWKGSLVAEVFHERRILPLENLFK